MTSIETSTAHAAKAPSHFAYHVRDREKGDAIWTRIGSAWQHADGKGFNVQIETLPLDGRIALRIRAEKTA
jgi:hypothetical protein